MAQYNQQFEKHHIATLRKWADGRGITQARWRSKALQLMVEEAAVGQVLGATELVPVIERMRGVAKSRGWDEVGAMSTQELVLLALANWLTPSTKKRIGDSRESSDS